MTKADTQKWSKTFLFSASLIGFLFVVFIVIQVILLMIAGRSILMILNSHYGVLGNLIKNLNIDPSALSGAINGFLQYFQHIISKILSLLIPSIIFWLTYKKSQKYKWLKYVSLVISVGLIGESGYLSIIGLFALAGSVLLIYEDIN